MDQFRIGGLISHAWQVFKSRMLFLWLCFAILWGVSFFFTMIEKSIGEKTLPGALFSLLSIAAAFLLQLGILRIYLNLLDGKEAKIEQLFSEYRLFWRYLGGSLLYGLGVVIGLVLFVFPGIYLGLRYCFFPYILVDQEVGILEAFKKSAQMTKGRKWHLFLLSLSLVGLNILGLLCLVVGLLFTVPVTALAFAGAYRALVQRSEEAVLVQKVKV